MTNFGHFFVLIMSCERLYFGIFNFQEYQISKLIFKTNYEVVIHLFSSRSVPILGIPLSKKSFRYYMKNPIMSRLLFNSV